MKTKLVKFYALAKKCILALSVFVVFLAIFTSMDISQDETETGAVGATILAIFIWKKLQKKFEL